VSLASTLELSEEEDELIWQFNSSDVYSSHSLYQLINFRGMRPIFIPTVWKIMVPPRVHFFLWLVSKNKILTRNNLAKRQSVVDMSCLFCAENETVCHLLSDCVVARQAWGVMSEVFGFQVGGGIMRRWRLVGCVIRNMGL
jgi:hypothetical protein